MTISSEEFKKLAHLARLEFSADEETSFKSSLSDFVSYLDKVKNLDTRSIEPMMRVDEGVRELRADIPRPGLTQAQALQNAPDPDLGHFGIPKIVG